MDSGSIIALVTDGCRKIRGAGSKQGGPAIRTVSFRFDCIRYSDAHGLNGGLRRGCRPFIASPMKPRLVPVLLLLALCTLAPAQVPSRAFDVRAHGAVGDGSTLDTDAINRAIEAAAAAGGG